jgi:hypothetical protein
MEAVHREVRALQEAVLGAEGHRTGKEALEEITVDEAHGVGVGERLVSGQPLGEAVAQEAAQVEAQSGHPQKLAHGADALQRPGDHELDEHDGVDRGAADALGVVGRRQLAHEAPVDEAIEPPVAVVFGHELIEADHLHLPGRLLAPLLTHGHDPPPVTRCNRPLTVLHARAAIPFWTGP